MMKNHCWFSFSVLLLIYVYKTNAHFYPINPPHHTPPTYAKHFGFHKNNELHLNDYLNTIEHHGFPEIELEPSFPHLTEVGSPFHPSTYSQPLFPAHRFPHNHHEPEIISDVRHKDVIIASLHEQALPPQLRNPFYKNHRIRSALAKHSWFHDGEMPVFERSSNQIPRSSIYKLLWNAGFLQKQH